MQKIKIKITTKSPVLVGSGKSFGSIIDSDIVFDEVGLPFIPSKRIKGLLRDSAIEVLDMFNACTLINKIDLTKKNEDYNLVEKVFGKPGNVEMPCVNIDNFYIEEYNIIKKELSTILKSKYNKIFNSNDILAGFTEIRRHTAIDPNSSIAKEHSLRTVRVIRKEIRFESLISVNCFDSEAIPLIILACKNLRKMGTKRNRGFGKIECVVENINEIKQFWGLDEIIKL